MKDSQLPLQPKHMCSNSIGDICFVSPNIQHLLVPCVLKFYGSFRYISRKATHAHTYMCVCVCIYIYIYVYIYIYDWHIWAKSFVSITHRWIRALRSFGM